MRRLLLASLFLAGPAHAQSGPPPQDHDPNRSRTLFLSPMGEPFRGPGGVAAWFAGADADQDGALTRTEFEADAQRFFKLLDQRGDGEIDPGDIERYENILVPEIRGFGMATGPRPGGRGGGRGRGGPPGGAGGDNGPGSGGGEDGKAAAGRQVRTSYGGQGAARFGYFDYPEPVTVADRNFNRGVDPREFERAADERFAILDKNGDGKLTESELPRRGGGGPRPDRTPIDGD